MARGPFDHKPIVSISASSITILIQIIFIVALLREFHCPTRASNRPNALHYAAWGVFTALALGFVAWIIEEMLYRLHANPSIWIIPYWIFFFFMALAYLFFYALMVIRLYLTFENTDMALSERGWKVHIFIIISFIFLGILVLIAHFMHYNDHIILTATFIIMVFAGMNLFHLVYAFNRRLFNITLSLRLSITNYDDGGNMVLNENQMVFLRTIRKHTLLGGIKVLTVVLDICIVIIFVITRSYVLWSIGWCISLNIASLCVYLGFSINKPTYDLICRRCDECCKKLCNALSRRSLTRRNSRSIGNENNPTSQSELNVRYQE